MTIDAQVKLPDGELVWGHRTVGPTNDPYHRDYVEMFRDGKSVWSLFMCSLMGDWLDDGNGDQIAANYDLLPLGEDYKRFARKVEEETGHKPHYWIRLQGKLEKAREKRMTSEERLLREVMQEIDARLISYM